MPNRDVSRMVPLVPGARYVVTCGGCGFAADSAAASARLAEAEVTRRHRCPARSLTARYVDYSTHPLHEGRP